MWDSDQKYFNNLLPCCRLHQLLSQQRRERRRETTLERLFFTASQKRKRKRRTTTLERFLQLLNLCTKDQTKTRPRSRSRPPLKEFQNFGLFARKGKQKKKKERGEGRPPKNFATFDSLHESDNTSLQRTRASELCCSPTSANLDQWKIFVGFISRKK